MRRTLLLLTAVLALAVAGCGSGSDSSSSSTGASVPKSLPTSTNGKTLTVDMKNITFSPKDVTLKVGQTIKWVNLDTVQHNVVADTGADFKSDTFGQNGTFEWTAVKPGKVTYECTLHPGMVGTITVR
jgi:plastocyanin